MKAIHLSAYGLLDLTYTLVSTLECRDVLRTVAANIRQLMHCDFVGMWLPDVEHVYLRQLAMDFPEGKGFAKEDALQPIEGSVISTVFKTGKPVVFDHISGQLAPDEATEVRAEALESGCALPLITEVARSVCSRSAAGSKTQSARKTLTS